MIRNRVLPILALVALGSLVLRAPAAACCCGKMGATTTAAVTVEGTVQQVLETETVAGAAGVHLLLETEGATHLIHVGPAALLAAKGFELAEGDRLEITGHLSRHSGTESLVAHTITEDGEVLVLAGADGSRHTPTTKGDGMKEGGMKGCGMKAGGCPCAKRKGGTATSVESDTPSSS